MTAAAADWIAVEADGRVRLLASACIALRLDATNCTACRDACPVSCIDVGEAKFSIGDQCIGCGHCAANCPTGALAVKGFDAQPAPGSGPVRIECFKVARAVSGEHAVRVPCLGGLSTSRWLNLLAAAAQRPLLAMDRSWCKQCEVATRMGGAHPARAALDRAAQLAAATGLPNDRLPRLEPAPLPPSQMPPRIPGDAPAAPSRRGFFLRIGNEARRAIGKDATAIPPPRALRALRMPLPEPERFRAALQRLADAARQLLPATAFHALDVAPSCANHGICAGVCPTQALTRYEEVVRAGVAFDAARCIGCGRCVDACPEHALLLKPAVTAPAGNLAVPLTAYARHVCRECSQPWFGPAGSADELRCPSCRRNRALGASLFGRT